MVSDEVRNSLNDGGMGILSVEVFVTSKSEDTDIAMLPLPTSPWFLPRRHEIENWDRNLVTLFLKINMKGRDFNGNIGCSERVWYRLQH